MDKSGEEANLEYIRMQYSAPQIIIEFELEASAGSITCNEFSTDPRCLDGNIYNPWGTP